jgi:serine acetyltransferase
MTQERRVFAEDAVHAASPIVPHVPKDFMAPLRSEEPRRKRTSALAFLFQDAKDNSPKIKCFLVLFRLASLFELRKKNPVYRLLYLLANSVYHLYSDLFAGIELPAGTPVGKNLTIHHGYGIVVGKGACLKDNVVLRQGVTIGNYVDRDGCISGNPVIESGVEFGAGACALGGITIGEGAFIGANCVVYKDVRAHARVYPGRCIVSSPFEVKKRSAVWKQI